MGQQLSLTSGRPLINDPGVKFVELVKAPSPQERSQTDGMTAIRTGLVLWDKSVRAKRAYLGWSELATYTPATARGINTVYKYVRRHPPEIYFRAVGGPFGTDYYLFATRVNQQGWQPKAEYDADSIGNWTWAHTVVEYSSLSYEIVTDDYMVHAYAPSLGSWILTSTGGRVPDEGSLLRYITKRVTPSSASFGVEKGAFKWVTNAASPPVVVQDVQKTLSDFQIQITWHAIPQEGVPSSYINPGLLPGGGWIEQTMGKINATPFAGMPIGCAFLSGCEFKPYRDAIGQRTYDITYTFRGFLQPLRGNPSDWLATGFATRTHLYAGNVPASTGGGRLAQGWYEISDDGTSNLVTQTNDRSLFDFAEFRNLFRPQ